jgi:hypothetical protein
MSSVIETLFLLPAPSNAPVCSKSRITISKVAPQASETADDNSNASTTDHVVFDGASGENISEFDADEEAYHPKPHLHRSVSIDASENAETSMCSDSSSGEETSEFEDVYEGASAQPVRKQKKQAEQDPNKKKKKKKKRGQGKKDSSKRAMRSVATALVVTAATTRHSELNVTDRIHVTRAPNG